MLSSCYVDRLKELRSIEFLQGKALSTHILAMTEELLKKVDSSYRFDITPSTHGDIYLMLSLPDELCQHYDAVFIISNDELKILTLGVSQALLDEGKSSYALPDELSDCAEFISKCLHSLS